MPSSTKPPTPKIAPTRKLKDTIALAGHPHYADHQLQFARRGPTAGKPKRVKADARRQVTPTQITNAHNAWLFAEHKGWRLNTWFTIIFDQLNGPSGWKPGEPPGPQVRAQGNRLNNSLSAWCREQRIPQAWIKSIENVSGRCPHADVAMHCSKMFLTRASAKGKAPQCHVRLDQMGKHRHDGD